MAMTWAMAMAMRLGLTKGSNDEVSRSDGGGNKGDGQAMKRATARVGMAIVTAMWMAVTKRAMARAVRAMATATNEASK
jgi:hypothetical protein